MKTEEGELRTVHVTTTDHPVSLALGMLGLYSWHYRARQMSTARAMQDRSAQRRR